MFKALDLKSRLCPSLIRLIASALGGFVVGFSYFLMVISLTDSKSYNASPHQWPLIIMGLIEGLLVLSLIHY